MMRAPSPAASCASEQLSAAAPPLVARSASASDVTASPYMLRRKNPPPPLRPLSVHDLQSYHQQQQPPQQQHHHHHYHHHHHHHHPQCWKHSQHQCGSVPPSPLAGQMSPLPIPGPKSTLHIAAEAMSPMPFSGILSPLPSAGTMSPRSVTSGAMSPLPITPLPSGAPTPGNATPVAEAATPVACSPRMPTANLPPTSSTGAVTVSPVEVAIPAPTAGARIHESNRRRLTILRDIFMVNPSGHYEACQELKDWCNDKRAYAAELAPDLDLTLRAASEMALIPGFDTGIALEVFKVVARHQSFMTEMAAENCRIYTQTLINVVRGKEIAVPFSHSHNQSLNFPSRSPSSQSPYETFFGQTERIKEEQPSTPMVGFMTGPTSSMDWDEVDIGFLGTDVQSQVLPTAGDAPRSLKTSAISMPTNFRADLSATNTTTIWDPSYLNFQGASYPAISSSHLSDIVAPSSPATALDTIDNKMDFSSMVALSEANVQIPTSSARDTSKDSMSSFLESMDHDWNSGMK